MRRTERKLRLLGFTPKLLNCCIVLRDAGCAPLLLAWPFHVPFFTQLLHFRRQKVVLTFVLFILAHRQLDQLIFQSILQRRHFVGAVRWQHLSGVDSFV